MKTRFGMHICDLEVSKVSIIKNICWWGAVSIHARLTLRQNKKKDGES